MAGTHDGMTPPAAALNVAISTDGEEQPLGLLALVNSTLSHTSSLAPGKIHHLRRREREPVFVSPFRFAAAYLPHCCRRYAACSGCTDC